MTEHKYVIVGGGMAAAAAVKGIREVDKDGSIALVSAEAFAPYDRPPLTKGLWKGRELDTIWRETPDREVEIFLSRRVTRLDPNEKSILDEEGKEFSYQRLLLATGGSPRRLPFGKDEILYYRNLSDYKHLRELTGENKHFAVIGGGFIGSEIAAALSMNGQQVTMIFPNKAIGDNIFPLGLAEHITDYYRDKGVEIVTQDKVADLEKRDGKSMLNTAQGKEIEADHILAGIGILPNVSLAEDAGLHVDDGIHVAEDLQTTQADIFAAGDVANFHSEVLGGRVRIEHEDNTNTMGAAAGRSMAGKPEPYKHLPMFYSDLFDNGYEAVGLLNSEHQLVEDWQEEPYKKGVVYYLDDGGCLRGVLLWNVWDKVDAARDLMRETGPKRAEDLIGRL